MFELTIGRSVLNKEMSFLREVLDKKPMNEVLSNYLFELKFNEEINNYDLFITATDLGQYLRTKVNDFDINYEEKNLSFLVPAKKLSDIIQKLPDCELKFKSTQYIGKSNSEVDGHLELKALRSTYNLVTYPAESFIQNPPKEDNLPVLHLPSDLIAEMCLRVLPSFSQDEEKDPRFNLTGIKFEYKVSKDKDGNLNRDEKGNFIKKLNLVFVLQSKVHFVTADLTDFDCLSTEDISCLLPKTTIKLLSRLCNKESTILKCQATPNRIFFSLGNKEFSSRILSGGFPNYLVMVDYKHSNLLKLNKKEFTNSLERALVVNDEKQQSVRLFNAKSNSIFIQSKTREANSEDIYDDPMLDIEGKEMQLNFFYNNIESYLRTETLEYINLYWDSKSMLKLGAFYYEDHFKTKTKDKSNLNNNKNPEVIEVNSNENERLDKKEEVKEEVKEESKGKLLFESYCIFATLKS